MTIDSDAFRERIGLLIGQEAVRTQGGTGAWSVDLRAPFAVVTPADLREITEMVKLANAEGLQVAPAGNGSWLHLGNIPERVDMVLRTTKLNRMVEFEPRDLTCTVEAGMSVVDLQKLVAVHGLFLPLDPPFGLRATVGGLAAANRYGPARLRYGTMRDWVLGATLLHADGSTSKAGGRVVKNVSGYDLTKLYIGSLGTLGVLVSLNLKLAPIPENRIALLGLAPSASAVDGFLKEVRRLTPLQPAAFVAVDAAARKDLHADAGPLAEPGPDAFAVAVRFADTAEVVEWACNETRRMAAAHGFVEAGEPLTGEKEAKFWTAISDFPVPWGKIVLRATTLPGQLLPFAAKARDAVRAASLEPAMLLHPALGVTYLRLARPPKIETAAPLIEAVRKIAAEGGGNVIVEAAPPAVKERIDVWGEPAESIEIQRKIKQLYDPNRIFNRGRFLGRI
ncbi:MAG: FAD-binding oxidoreductase [Planctomycetes bacterium]|nr:FAD-binding oxidoreductase [Planctomycetota bacterium]MBI3848479.1 FAD-binding oxidoreductase [Planctomycetota bacterium]